MTQPLSPEDQQTHINADNIGIVGDHAHVEGGIHFHSDHPQRDKNLNILLDIVREIWVDGYLNNALLNAIYIDLGLQKKQDAVPQHQPFAELNIGLRESDQAEQDLPTGTRAYDIYQQAQGRLLILGQPGSGKTTILAILARDLLDEAENDQTAPVPVIFNLSSWAAAQKPLAAWLEDELNHQYQVSRKLAQTWLAEERLTLLLDGLDEVAGEQRKACVSAINAYRADSSMGPLVVCSRLHDYEALQAKLNLEQAIVLKTLTQSQVEQYFQRLTGEQDDAPAAAGLQSLYERIFQDDSLRELTETPLMLNIITITYAQPQAPAMPQGEGEALWDQIFDAYSEHMFNRTGRTKMNLLHSKEDTLHYLRYLAAQLQAHSLTQFSIGQIRGSWLSDYKTYCWLSGLYFGLIFGLIIGLIFGLIIGLSDGLIFALSDGLSDGLILKLIFRLIDGLIFGLILGLIFGLIFGLCFGGRCYYEGFLLQHYLRLWLLNRHHLLPFKLIPFLNQATDLLFLQRLGGSYRFIHRSVQEHFAAQWAEIEMDRMRIT
jgi:hypothetical protein